jgi:hypothetical protein
MTFSYQAHDSYARCGYSVFGQLGDHPDGCTPYFMKKPQLGCFGHDA